MQETVKIYYGKYSLQHWVNLILQKNILLPDYQRIFVWSEKEISELIKAFSENQYIPPVTIGCFSKGSGNKNYIIDGQQRLTAILLAYLGIFLNKEKFLKQRESNEDIYDEDGNLMEDDYLDYMEWRFDNLVTEATNKVEILEKINPAFYDKDVDYGVKKYNENNSESKNFFKDNFLGFTFIVPISQTEEDQNKFYAKVFRNINTKGKKLNNLGSREGFYFIDKTKKDLLRPEFIRKYKVGKQEIDFVRYLSLLSQYYHSSSEKDLAKGYSGRMEDYYICYLEHTLGENEHNEFPDYDSVFKDKDHTKRLEKLEDAMKELDFQDIKFSSFIEADYYLFGLIYVILFENKSIDTDMDRKKELKKSLEDAFAKDEYKGKNANAVTQLRPRVRNSISIYRGYAQ